MSSQPLLLSFSPSFFYRPSLPLLSLPFFFPVPRPSSFHYGCPNATVLGRGFRHSLFPIVGPIVLSPSFFLCVCERVKA